MRSCKKRKPPEFLRARVTPSGRGGTAAKSLAAKPLSSPPAGGTWVGFGEQSRVNSGEFRRLGGVADGVGRAYSAPPDPRRVRADMVGLVVCSSSAGRSGAGFAREPGFVGIQPPKRPADTAFRCQRTSIIRSPALKPASIFGHRRSIAARRAFVRQFPKRIQMSRGFAE